MQVYEILSGKGVDGLQRGERDAPQPGRGQVCVRIKAVALNFRDLMIADGVYPGSSPNAVIPASDAVGEVMAVGEHVSRFKPGDRVVNNFFPDWQAGAPTPARTAATFGAASDGVLAEQVVFDEAALAFAPPQLDDAAAATLTCAGVTAWNAIFEAGRARPGDTVLLLGTGGVSVWGLQLAKAAGMRAIITSSSDDKLEKARALGADGTINYRSQPEWHDEVMRLTGGRGADVVLEVGGQDTMPRSLASANMGATISVIGGVGGFGASQIAPMDLIGGARHIAGIYVGSRQMLEDLAALVGVTGLVPVVDRVFGFDEVPAAYAHLKAGRHFGKVVIELAS